MKTENENEHEIGEICNYYGRLTVRSEDGKYFWGIEDWDGSFDWEEIPKVLYDELMKFENDRMKNSGEEENE